MTAEREHLQAMLVWGAGGGHAATRSFGVTAACVKSRILTANAIEGRRRPVSMLLIIHLDTPSFSARASCEMFLLFRQAANACSFAINLCCHIANSNSRASLSKSWQPGCLLLPWRQLS